MVPDWTSPLVLMAYGTVQCPRKWGDSLAFGKCQQLRDQEACARCLFNDVVWFPSEKMIKTTYKKTCQKAGHLKGSVFLCKDCVLRAALYSYDCFEKNHTPERKEICQTCGEKD